MPKVDQRRGHARESHRVAAWKRIRIERDRKTAQFAIGHIRAGPHKISLNGRIKGVQNGCCRERGGYHSEGGQAPPNNHGSGYRRIDPTVAKLCNRHRQLPKHRTFGRPGDDFDDQQFPCADTLSCAQQSRSANCKSSDDSCQGMAIRKGFSVLLSIALAHTCPSQGGNWGYRHIMDIAWSRQDRQRRSVDAPAGRIGRVSASGPDSGHRGQGHPLATHRSRL